MKTLSYNMIPTMIVIALNVKDIVARVGDTSISTLICWDPLSKIATFPKSNKIKESTPSDSRLNDFLAWKVLHIWVDILWNFLISKTLWKAFLRESHE